MKTSVPWFCIVVVVLFSLRADICQSQALLCLTIFNEWYYNRGRVFFIQNCSDIAVYLARFIIYNSDYYEERIRKTVHQLN